MEFIESDMVMTALKNHYPFTITDCTLFGHYFHDNYVINTNKGEYFVRVYKEGVRDRSEILFEIDFINHLQRNDFSISFPIPRKDKRFITELNTSKGKRYIVIFSFALGKFPEATGDVSYLFGKFIAEFQSISKSFVTNYERSYKFDLEEVIDKPLEIMRPFLQYRTEDLDYLEELAVVMKSRIKSLPIHNLSKGPVHGDLHFMNLYINNNNEFTLFDFDCCAIGLQIFDLGTIRWDFAFLDDLWEMFLKGYSELKELSDVEIKAIPLFATVRSYWAIGHNLTYKNRFELKEFDDDYWDDNIKFIKKWVVKNSYM